MLMPRWTSRSVAISFLPTSIVSSTFKDVNTKLNPFCTHKVPTNIQPCHNSTQLIISNVHPPPHHPLSSTHSPFKENPLRRFIEWPEVLTLSLFRRAHPVWPPQLLPDGLTGLPLVLYRRHRLQTKLLFQLHLKK